MDEYYDKQLKEEIGKADDTVTNSSENDLGFERTPQFLK